MMTARKLPTGYLLNELLQGLVEGIPSSDIRVTGISTDSRKIKPGDLFIAHAIGERSGVYYIGDAVKAGACAVIAEAATLPDPYLCSVPVLRIRDLYKKTGIIADRFYDHPSAMMTVIGVTGTNGKTSVSYLLAQSLSGDGENSSGLIGTLGYGLVEHLLPGPHTTPEAVTLHELLAGMRDQKIKQVVMEVSSHGLEQFRTAGVDIDLAIFTNLTRDHLDYHGSMKSYAAAKRRLFTDYGIKKVIINVDDKFGRKLVGELPQDVIAIAYTLDSNKDLGKNRTVSGKIISVTPGKTSIKIESPWGEAELTTRLSGRFNVYNVMACLSALCLLGHSLEDAIARLSRCDSIPGRMEVFGRDNLPQVIVDYAHTPDALEQVLATLKTACKGKLFCVFGCGGDRDKGKRPLMGTTVEKYADRIFVTNDNPRNENPEDIIKDIIAGIKHHDRVNTDIDRERSIQNAIKEASASDMVLIAGKGHENYQEVAGVRYPFSDQQVVRKALGMLS